MVEWCRFQTVHFHQHLLLTVQLRNTDFFNETVGISYDSDIKKAKEILKCIAENCEHRTEAEPVQVFVSELADSAVLIGLRFPIEINYFWQAKWDTLEEIKKRFDKAGIEICFNQLDVHIKDK